MLKKALLIIVCISSSFVLCSTDLENAVEELNVERVSEILEESPQALTEFKAIELAGQLSKRMWDAKVNKDTKLFLGICGGFIAGLIGAAGLVLTQPEEQVSPLLFKINVLGALGSLVAGPFLGYALSRKMVKAFPYEKAQTIVYFLTRNLNAQQIERLKLFNVLKNF